MRAERQAVFNGIGLHEVEQHLLQQMVFIRGFFPATSSARFSRSERYFAMALLAPRLERQTPRRRPRGLVKPSA
jgi:hypothetical protein